jgi:hypothetical protein
LRILTYRNIKEISIQFKYNLENEEHSNGVCDATTVTVSADVFNRKLLKLVPILTRFVHPMKRLNIILLDMH